MHKQTKVGDRHGGSGGTTITGETQPIDTLNKILTLYCNLSLLALRLLPKPVLYTIFLLFNIFQTAAQAAAWLCWLIQTHIHKIIVHVCYFANCYLSISRVKNACLLFERN